MLGVSTSSFACCCLIVSERDLLPKPKFCGMDQCGHVDRLTSGLVLFLTGHSESFYFPAP